MKRGVFVVTIVCCLSFLSSVLVQTGAEAAAHGLRSGNSGTTNVPVVRPKTPAPKASALVERGPPSLPSGPRLSRVVNAAGLAHVVQGASVELALTSSLQSLGRSAAIPASPRALRRSMPRPHANSGANRAAGAVRIPAKVKPDIGPTCTIYWTGKANDGNWATVGNWSLTNGGSSAAAAPGSSDFVCMSTSPTAASVTSSGAVTIAGINWPVAGSVSPSLSLTGNTFTVTTDNSTVNSLSVTSTVTIGSGVTLTVTTLTGSGPTINGPGGLTLATGGTDTLNDAQLRSGLALLNKGSLSTASNDYVYLYGASTIENGGSWTVGDGTTVYPADGTAVSLTNDASSSISYTGSLSSSLSYIEVPFTNKGTVTIGKGNLQLTAGTVPSTSDTGSYSVAAGAQLEIQAARTFASTVAVTGAGTLYVDAVLTVASAASLPGTVTVPGGSLTINGGTATISSLTVGATLSLASGVAITTPSLTVNSGTIIGPGSLTISTGGSATLFDGQIKGGLALLNKGSLSLPTSDYMYFYTASTFENAGAVTMGDNSDFYNADNTANSMTNDLGATISYTGSTASSVTYIQVPFTNNGSITINKGIFQVNAIQAPSTSDGGSYSISAGAVLQLYSTRSLGSGGSISGAGTLFVGGTLTATSAASLPGTINVQSKLSITGGAPATIASLTVAGTLTLASGVAITTPSLTVNSGTLTGPGGLTISMGGSATFNTAFLNGGLALLNKGALSLPANVNMYFYAASTFENAGSVMVGDSSNFYNADNTAVSMTNDQGASISYAGSTNSTTSYIQVPFTNNGTITVTKGIYQINATNVPSTSDTGSYAVSSGAVLQLYNTRTLAAAATITGAGTLNVEGTVTAAAASTLPATVIIPGSLTVSSGSATPSSLTVSGTLTLSSGVAINAPSLTVNGGTIYGPGSLTVPNSGTATATYAYLRDLPFTNDGTLTISTNTVVYLYASSSVENSGTTTLGDSSQIYDADSTANSLVNDVAATISYTGSTSSTYAYIQAPFTNNGSVSVGKGILQITFGSIPTTSDTGNYSIAAGAVLQLTSARTIGSAESITGAGTLLVSTTLTVIGTHVITPLTVGGTLTLSSGSSLTTPKLTLNGATVTGPGTLGLAPGGTGIVNTVYFEGGMTFANQGHIALPSNDSFYLYSGSTIQNSGFIQMGENAQIAKEDSSNISLTNEVGGIISFAGSGPWATAYIQVPVTNDGTLEADRGTLQLSSAPVLGSIAVKVWSPTDFGQIALNGPGTIGGTLTVLTDSGYKPPLDATFQIVTTTALTGTFSTLQNGIPGGDSYQPSYSATAVTVDVLEAPTFTSASSKAFTVTTPGTFTVTTAAHPTVSTINESGALPNGVKFTDNGDGTATIAGTAVAGTQGSYPLTLTAVNGAIPNGTQHFTLVIQLSPSITSGHSTTFTAGTNNTFTVTTTGYPPPALTETGALPEGVTFTDNSNGTATLSGAPSLGTGGTYNLTISGANGVAPNATQAFTLQVIQLPAFTSPATAVFTPGKHGTFTVVSTGFPLPKLKVTGKLPKGVKLVIHKNGTATISGKPTQKTGSGYILTCTATSTAGSVTQKLLIVVQTKPAFKSKSTAGFTIGKTATFTIATTGYPYPVITEVGVLPSGLQFIPALNGTAKLTGKPAVGTAKTYTLKLSAKNSVSTATQTLTLKVVK
jgi:hypothetical protein